MTYWESAKKDNAVREPRLDNQLLITSTFCKVGYPVAPLLGVIYKTKRSGGGEPHKLQTPLDT